jgi:NADH-ubiquinone oxidoreductase chain 5
LLINYWFTRIQAGKSAIKAMLINRIGDLALILAICSIFVVFKTLDYYIIFNLIPCTHDLNTCVLSINTNCHFIISLLLFLGSIGKSAQLGLHV